MRLSEFERALLRIGAILIVGALCITVVAEVRTRRDVVELRRLASQAGSQAVAARLHNADQLAHLEYTLATRWSIPRGHAAQGAAGVGLGLLLITWGLVRGARRTSRHRPSSDL